MARQTIKEIEERLSLIKIDDSIKRKNLKIKQEID